MTLRHSNIIFTLSLLLLIIVIFLTGFVFDGGIAQEGVIYFEYSTISASYGDTFWNNATLREDGKLQFKGDVDNQNFVINPNGTMYLVYEPHGRVSKSQPMSKLTNAEGKIIAPPGTYELSVSPANYPTNNYAYIIDDKNEVVSSKVCFNKGETYTIKKREIEITVDDSNLLRFYGGSEVELYYVFLPPGSNQLVNGDTLQVTLVSQGNNIDAAVGEYDIELSEYILTNGDVDKSDYYRIRYDNPPKLKVEKYVIKAKGLGTQVDYYRHDGDYFAAFENIYEEIDGINDEKVRIYYTLDEDKIERVNGLLSVNLEGYPTTLDTSRLEVYNAQDELVDSADNYEIDLSQNDTILIVEKRDVTLYTNEFDDENGVLIEKDSLRETYGYAAASQFKRTINVLGEDIDCMLALPYAHSIPVAGEHIVILLNAENPFYNISLDNSVKFIIDKYIIKLIDYMDTTEEGKAIIDVEYGKGFFEYTDTLQVEEIYEVTYTLKSSVTRTSHPGEYYFDSYEEMDNFAIDYSDVIIRVGKKEVFLKIVMPSTSGIAYGDEYSIELEGVVKDYPIQITTRYWEVGELDPENAKEGKPYLAGIYTVRLEVEEHALDFYTLGEEEKGHLEFELTITRRNINVIFNLHTNTKEYNTELSLSELGTLVHHHESDPSIAGLIGEDNLIEDGNITCTGLTKAAQTGSYLVNTSKLSNANYNIIGGSVKVFFNGQETSILTVTKLKQANLPDFSAKIMSHNTNSITLSNIQINGVNIGSFALSKDDGITYSEYRTSNVFSDLSEGKRYYFKVRIKGDLNIEEGLESEPIYYVIPLSTPPIKKTSINFPTTQSVAIELDVKTPKDIQYQYFYRIGDGEWTENNVFDGLDAGTRYQIRYKCVTKDAESKVGSTFLWTLNKAPVLDEEIVFLIEPNRIFYNGLSKDYEYRIAVNGKNIDETDFSSWSLQLEFEDLIESTEYLLQIRTKASPTTGNIAGESLSLVLTTPELIIEQAPISYDGIMEYVARYYLVGISGFMLILMVSLIIGFAAKLKVV